LKSIEMNSIEQMAFFSEPATKQNNSNFNHITNPLECIQPFEYNYSVLVVQHLPALAAPAPAACSDPVLLPVPHPPLHVLSLQEPPLLHPPPPPLKNQEECSPESDPLLHREWHSELDQLLLIKQLEPWRDPLVDLQREKKAFRPLSSNSSRDSSPRVRNSFRVHVRRTSKCFSSV